LTYVHCFWVSFAAPSWIQMVLVQCGSRLRPLQKHSHTYIRYIEGIQPHSIAVNRSMGTLSVHSMSLPCPGLVPNWVQIQITPP
jgi:hypothetical protein